MIWIESRYEEDIPQDLYYDGYQTDRNKNGETALMLWIESRYGENIPQELLYRPSV